MKKIITVICVFLVSTSLFATGYVRSNLNIFSFTHAKSENSETNTIDTSTPLNISAGYLFDISKKNAIGLDLTLGFDYTKNEQNGSESIASGFVFEANLADLFKITDKLSMLVAAGFHGEFTETKNTGAKINMNLYGIGVNCGLLYNVTSNFALSAGLDFDAVFGGKATMTSGGIKQENDVDISGVVISPYIGASFLF